MQNQTKRSDEARMARVWDIEAIKNLAHRRTFYQTNNERQRELDDLWVREPEHQATASIGATWGYYVGMDEVRRYTLAVNPARPGYSSFMPLSSHAIQIAGDGKTAQGLRYSIAEQSNTDADGVTKACWTIGKVGIDFVRETDGWRIWHLFRAGDVYCEPGKNVQDEPVDPVPGAPYPCPACDFFGKPTLEMQAYVNRYSNYPYPPAPTAYETFSDIVSNGSAGNPKFTGWEEKK